MKHLIISILFFGVFGATSAQAAVIHDESVDGDLSSVANLPSPLGLGLGANDVVGQVGNLRNTPEDDRDVFSFTVGAGQSVTSIVLVDYVMDDPDDADPYDVTRFVLYTGTEGNDGMFVGQADVNGADVGEDMLLTITPPSPDLAPGDYSILINEFHNVEVAYQFVINLTSTLSGRLQLQVPAPGTLPLLLVALAGLARVASRAPGQVAHGG